MNPAPCQTSNHIEARLGRTATLATRMDLVAVTLVPQGRRSCHSSHSNLDSSQGSDIGGDNPLIKGWVRIMLAEGHIEPSQSHIGRIVGWPVRSFLKYSLWVDFLCWCYAAGLRDSQIPAKGAFLAVLNAVLDPVDNGYVFPPLSECRQRAERIWVGR
jgi:hypothetical protein